MKKLRGWVSCPRTLISYLAPKVWVLNSAASVSPGTFRSVILWPRPRRTGSESEQGPQQILVHMGGWEDWSPNHYEILKARFIRVVPNTNICIEKLYLKLCGHFLKTEQFILEIGPPKFFIQLPMNWVYIQSYHWLKNYSIRSLKMFFSWISCLI